MSESNKDLYAASVNPPRRAKRAPVATHEPLELPTTTTTTPLSPRAILPMRPYVPRTPAVATEPAEAPPPPAKRGRKPGPLSRTAREAQRRLNHSIIEKARRTKINDALAALKQLVPVNYGQQQATAIDTITEENDDDENDNDDDYEEGNSTKPSKSQTATNSSMKAKGKKEEKEKEFKLEILIRTVSFLRDLLQRVAVLEASGVANSVQGPSQSTSSSMPRPEQSNHLHTCPACSAPLHTTNKRHQGKKRKRAPAERDSDGYSSDYDGTFNSEGNRDGQGDTMSSPRLPPAPAHQRRAKVARRSAGSAPATISVSGPADARIEDIPGPELQSMTGALHSPPLLPRRASSPARTGYTQNSHTNPSPPSPVPANSARLPPISSWLECVLDPQLPGAHGRGVVSSQAPIEPSHQRTDDAPRVSKAPAYLPSPPASTRFAPAHGAHAPPPFLSLGPVATAALVGPSPGGGPGAAGAARTPEDESAASLLLQIAASPPFRAVRSGSLSSASSAASVPTAGEGHMMGAPSGRAARGKGPAWTLPDPTGFSLHGGAPAGHGREHARALDSARGVQVQTPSSLLGLDLGMVGGPVVRY